MTFPGFAQRLYPVIGACKNTAVFTKTLFEYLVGDDNSELLGDISLARHKAYLYGNTSITRIERKAVSYIEVGHFYNYIGEDLNDSMHQGLADTIQKQ